MLEIIVVRRRLPVPPILMHTAGARCSITLNIRLKSFRHFGKRIWQMYVDRRKKWRVKDSNDKTMRLKPPTDQPTLSMRGSSIL